VCGIDSINPSASIRRRTWRLKLTSLDDHFRASRSLEIESARNLGYNGLNPSLSVTFKPMGTYHEVFNSRVSPFVPWTNIVKLCVQNG